MLCSSKDDASVLVVPTRRSVIHTVSYPPEVEEGRQRPDLPGIDLRGRQALLQPGARESERAAFHDQCQPGHQQRIAQRACTEYKTPCLEEGIAHGPSMSSLSSGIGKILSDPDTTSRTTQRARLAFRRTVDELVNCNLLRQGDAILTFSAKEALQELLPVVVAGAAPQKAEQGDGQRTAPSEWPFARQPLRKDIAAAAERTRSQRLQNAQS